jgi:hypothetical protein
LAMHAQWQDDTEWVGRRLVRVSLKQKSVACYSCQRLELPKEISEGWAVISERTSSATGTERQYY